MRSSSILAAELHESKIVQEVTGYAQNTHLQIVTNDIGKLILRLRAIYLNTDFGEKPSANEIEALYKIYKKEWQESKCSLDAVNFFISRLEAPIHSEFDRVSLYLPEKQTLSSNKVEYLQVEFPLKEVAVLIYKALGDDKRFMHHFQGSDDEKLAAAKKARADRLFSLYALMELLKKKGNICNQGIRHEMALLLNHSFEDVDIIEVPKSNILAFYKEGLIKRYFSASKNSEEKEQKNDLHRAFIAWMANPTHFDELLKQVDPKQSIYTEVKDFFIEHGSHPEVIKLDDLIKDSLSKGLLFTCDSKAHPTYSKINAILRLDADNEKLTDYAAALKSMQKWLIESADPTNEIHQKKIGQFHLIYETQMDWEKYKTSMQLSYHDTSNNFDTVSILIKKYFSSFEKEEKTLSLSEDELNQLKSIQEKLREFKNEMGSVETFFAKFNAAVCDRNMGEVRRLYALFCNAEFQEKALLSDEKLKQLSKSNPTTEWQADTNVLQLNQFILSALIQNVVSITGSKGGWSELFVQEFKAVLSFINKYFGENGESNAQNEKEKFLISSLKNHSYTKSLLAQLNYLMAIKEDKEVKESERPISFLWLPNQIKNVKEWKSIWCVLPPEKREWAYAQASPIRVKKWLREKYKNISIRGCEFHPMRGCLFLPVSEWKSYLGDTAKDYQRPDFLSQNLTLKKYLQEIGQESAIHFIRNIITVDVLKNAIERNPKEVILSLLIELPKNDVIQLLRDDIGIDFLRVYMSTGSDVRSMIYGNNGSGYMNHFPRDTSKCQSLLRIWLELGFFVDQPSELSVAITFDGNNTVEFMRSLDVSYWRAWSLHGLVSLLEAGKIKLTSAEKTAFLEWIGFSHLNQFKFSAESKSESKSHSNSTINLAEVVSFAEMLDTKEKKTQFFKSLGAKVTSLKMWGPESVCRLIKLMPEHMHSVIANTYFPDVIEYIDSWGHIENQLLKKIYDASSVKGKQQIQDKFFSDKKYFDKVVSNAYPQEIKAYKLAQCMGVLLSQDLSGQHSHEYGSICSISKSIDDLFMKRFNETKKFNEENVKKLFEEYRALHDCLEYILITNFNSGRDAYEKNKLFEKFNTLFERYKNESITLKFFIEDIHANMMTLQQLTLANSDTFKLRSLIREEKHSNNLMDELAIAIELGQKDPEKAQQQVEKCHAKIVDVLFREHIKPLEEITEDLRKRIKQDRSYFFTPSVHDYWKLLSVEQRTDLLKQVLKIPEVRITQTSSVTMSQPSSSSRG